MPNSMESLQFLTEAQVLELRARFGSPIYVYDEATLRAQARKALDFPNAYGLQVRYAMKALPTGAILRLFNSMGIHVDASSGFEARRALAAGIAPEQIQITAQQMPDDLESLLDLGVLFNCCSLHQLDTYGRLRPGTDASVRINPGLGSGHSNRTNTGGPSASYGIWHEHLDEVFATAKRHGLRIARMHTHIGSGADPEMWNRCAILSLGVAAQLAEVKLISLGGGFKVARVDGEVSADLDVIGKRIAADVEEFHSRHNRKLKIEIEPGTFLVANAGAVICTVIDVVDTGHAGYSFIKVDSGMTDNPRPAMYGAQHPLTLVAVETGVEPGGRPERDYVVAGHCCESGDILTPEPGNPEGIRPRALKEARIGDALVMGGVGAYCSAMACKNYNSFPESAEVLLTENGPVVIRERQLLEHIIQNERY